MRQALWHPGFLGRTGCVKTPLYAHPQAATMSEIFPLARPRSKRDEEVRGQGAGPEISATSWAKVLARGNPSLRNPITLEATLFRSFGGCFRPFE